MTKNAETRVNMVRAAWLLGLFAVFTTTLVAVSYDVTRGRIAANQREAVLRSLHEIIPPHLHDNDLVQDAIQVTDRELLGTPKPLTIYRARRDGKPTAAIIACEAPDGYSGPIRMLVGVLYDGTIAGVRITAHKETPGLGDYIEEDKSDWIQGFDFKSLYDPHEQGWHVRRDGGIFDQVSGATVTPRAVVKATRNALLYYAGHRYEIFTKPAESTEATS